ncbi:MAG: glycosyltransferase family 9 protein, partial [Candidatus Firestonebacteria bacterium]
AAASKADFKVVNNHNGKNYFTSIRVGKPEEYEDAIERDLDCLRAVGIPVRSRKVKIWLSKDESIDIQKLGFSVRNKDKIIGISVSASRQNKMWFKERFAELADKLIEDYHFKVIYIEDPGNPETLKQIVRLMKSKPFTICERNLRKVIALISGFDLFIGNDSGLLHAAVALGIPSISIVGPEEPKIFNPYSSRDKHYTLSADVDCKPCWKNACSRPLCLEAISVNQVLQSVVKAVK